MQDDAEAERRLSQAKRSQASAPVPPAKRQHFGPIDSEDEDEDAAEVCKTFLDMHMAVI